MKTLKNIFIKPVILLLMFLSIAALIFFSAYYELQQSKKEMLHLMAEEAHSLLQSIIISSQEILYASDEVETEIQDRLLNNANTIKILHNQNIISNNILNQIATQNGINRIHIFNKKGNLLFKSHPQNVHAPMSAQSVKIQLQPIFSDHVDTLIVGLKKARMEEEYRYVVAIGSKNNDAIVLNLNAAELLAFKKRIGFGVLIKRLTEDREIQFAILENENGILAASGNIEGVELLNNIDSLQWSISDSTYKWRIANYNELDILEALHPFDLEGDFIGYYRLGLSLQPLETINARLQRRIIISAIILFIVGIIMITLVLVRQNLDLVRRQYLKIETYSKKLIESVSDAIIVVNNKNSITEINRSTETLFESSKNTFIGKELKDVLGKNCPNTFAEESGIQQVECKIKNRIKQLLISKSKFIDENENENFVFIIKDLTELKKLEKQIARNDQMNAMGQLASGVAHEIRNPLNSIATIVQQLDKDFEPTADNEEYHSLAKIVSKEVKRMNVTIENFLRFSKPEAIVKKQFQLDDLINAIAEQFTPLFDEKGIKFKLTVNWHGLVNWDKNQIKQVLINLIKNSIESIHSSGKIELVISNIDQNIVLKVIDNGVGIPKENLQKIFNLYFTSKAKGTGIGLSIIQRIINEHDGIITVESNNEAGTIFSITIPINT
jgi:PAS domain S-box-containing protein